MLTRDSKWLLRCLSWTGVIGLILGSAYVIAQRNSTAPVLPLQFNPYVVGQPISAVRVLDFEPSPDAGPGILAVHGEEKFFRDSAGRTRSEIRYGDGPTWIHILDPLTKTHTAWREGTSEMTVSDMPEPRVAAAAGPATQSDRPSYREIEGIPTRGMERAHPVGPTRADQVLQSWYAPDLHLSLLMVTEMPAVGRTTYAFHHIVRSEPDPSLFRAPGGMTVAGTETTPPMPPNGLPHPITDDNFGAAMGRFDRSVSGYQAVTKATHRHVDLRMVDVKGHETTGSIDEWQQGQGVSRIEEHAPDWERTTVFADYKSWTKEMGVQPLRIIEFGNVSQRPLLAERRLLGDGRSVPKLRIESKMGTNIACAQDFYSASVCFDTTTGFLISGSFDGESIVYDGWQPWEGKFIAGVITVFRGKRLQLEAKTSMSLRSSTPSDFFSPPPGARLMDMSRPNGLPVGEQPEHTVLHRSQMRTSIFGSAVVKVWVDTKGKVKKAELQDTDDPSLGAAATEAAKSTIYEPAQKDGVYVPFETTLYFVSDSPTRTP